MVTVKIKPKIKVTIKSLKQSQQITFFYKYTKYCMSLWENKFERKETAGTDFSIFKEIEINK